MNAFADLILFNGRVTTLDRQNPQARAIAVRDGRFQAVGEERDIMSLPCAETQRIGLKGPRGIPSLIDRHMHGIPAALNSNLPLPRPTPPSLPHAPATLTT